MGFRRRRGRTCLIANAPNSFPGTFYRERNVSVARFWHASPRHTASRFRFKLRLFNVCLLILDDAFVNIVFSSRIRSLINCKQHSRCESCTETGTFKNAPRTNIINVRFVFFWSEPVRNNEVKKTIVRWWEWGWSGWRRWNGQKASRARRRHFFRGDRSATSSPENSFNLVLFEERRSGDVSPPSPRRFYLICRFIVAAVLQRTQPAIS